MRRRIEGPPGKARILEAAIELVAEGGNARASISEICKRARVQPPAVYYHYGSKDNLVAAVVESVAVAWLDELEAMATQGRTFEALLAAALRGWRALILQPDGPTLLLTRIQLECADKSATIREALRRVMSRARVVVSRSLEGVVGPIASADEIAVTIISLVQGAALQHHLEKDEAALDRRLAEIGNTIRLLTQAHRSVEKTPRRTS
jgi:AcrR family transcriptional regulator